MLVPITPPPMMTIRVWRGKPVVVISRAADRLHISQAAVSQQIRNLEADLENALFVRAHRKLTLTPRGKTYLDAVEDALERLNRATEHLFPAPAPNRVVIRCTSSVATLWLAPQIGAFRATHPDIDISILTHEDPVEGQNPTRTDLELFVAEGDSDLANAQALLTASVIPVASAKLFSDRPGPNSAAELAAFPLIHIVGYKDDWHSWFHQYAPATGPIPAGLTVDGSLTAIEASLQGDGIMLGRRPFIDAYLASGQLVRVLPDPCALTAHYWLRTSRTRTARKNVKAVAAWLKEIAGRKA